MKKIWIVGIILLAVCNGTFAASFDCNKAATATEKAICSDSELSKLDETMGSVYSKVFAINPDIKSSQLDWIKGNRQCTESLNLVSCLKDSYKNRLSVLNQLSDTNRGWIGFEINGLVNTNQGIGVAVGKISPNSPAQASGLQTGDIVYQINGKSISDPKSVISALSVPSGSLLNLKIINNGNPKELTITAGVHPLTQPTQEQQVVQPELPNEPSTQLTQEQQVVQPDPATESSAPTASESQTDSNLASSTDQVTTPEAAQQVEQTSALPEIPANETPVETESSSGSSSVLTIILAAILGGGVVFWFLRKKKDTPKITEPKLQPVVVKQEPLVDSSFIPPEKKSTKEIKVHHHASEQAPKVAAQKIVDTKVEEVSEPERSEKVNISMSQLRTFMLDENKDEDTSIESTSASVENLKFELVIMEGNKRLYELPLSYESVQSIVSSTPDNKLNEDLFVLASQHPSAAVRQSLACKDTLSEQIISVLSNDFSVNVLRNLVSSNGFREHATHDVLASIISRDNQAAQTIAGGADSFDQVSAKAIAKLIKDNGDPAVIEMLDEEYR
jgi:uncharacterized protein